MAPILESRGLRCDGGFRHITLLLYIGAIVVLVVDSVPSPKQIGGAAFGVQLWPHLGG